MAAVPPLEERPGNAALRIKASDWEKYGEGLSLKQEEALDAVRRAFLTDDDDTLLSTASTTGRPGMTSTVPSPDTADLTARVSPKQAKKSSSSTDPCALSTKTEFYQWFSDLEAARASEVEAKYKKHAEGVEKQVNVCNELLAEIGSVLDIFSDLRMSQRAISGRADALKEQCDRLVSDREKLMTISGSITERLDHFNRLEELSSLFHAPVSAESDPQKILRGLEDLDTSLRFTSKHPEYLESAKYHAKFQSLQKRAMSLVKSYFEESVASAVAECKTPVLDHEQGADMEGTVHENGEKRINGEHNGNGGPGDDLDTSGDMTIQNVKFRAVAESRLKELMAGVCRETERESYIELLRECSKAYCKARFELVRYGVLSGIQQRSHGSGSAPTESDASLKSNSVTRTLIEAAEIVSRMAEAEIQLYQHIFHGTNQLQAAAMLFPLFDSMCILLAAVMEPMVYSLSEDVQGLCQINAELIDLIRHQTLHVVFDVPSVKKLVQGVEQMIIRQAKKDWKKGLLEHSAALSIGKTVSKAGEGSTSSQPMMLAASDADFLRDVHGPLSAAVCRSHHNPEPFEPVARGIRMMTAVQASVSGCNTIELMRVIVPELLDIVHRASESHKDSPSQSISPTSAKTADGSEAFGAIFALRQLCLLSQCLESLRVAELDAESSNIGEKTIGHATAREQATRAQRGFVSSLSSRIPLLASISSLASRSSHTAPGGLSGAELKAVLDKKTAIARDFCILTCAQEATNPLLSFLTKVTAAKMSGREQIKSHAFATLERVKQLAMGVRRAIEGPILKNVALLYMMLPEPELTAVLQAVRANLEDAQVQMQDVIEAEYTAEEVRDIGFISFEETKKMIFEN